MEVGTRTVALSLLGLLTPGFVAAAPRPSASVYELLLEALTEECPGIAASIGSDANLKAVYQGRPMDQARICACTMAGVRGDRKFRQEFEGRSVDALEQLRSPALMSYTSALLIRHSFSCIAEDIDAALGSYRFAP
jgi:hypothetical protein